MILWEYCFELCNFYPLNFENYAKIESEYFFCFPSYTDTQSPTLRKRTSSMCSTSAKVRASEESLLSGANSCVIEESASSGGDSSPSSGVVYKNIIINLGGTSNVPGEIVDIRPPPSFESHHHDIGMDAGNYMSGA